MNPLEILRTVAVAFFENPRDFLVGVLLTIVAVIVFWEIALPALWQQYSPFG